MRLVHVTFFLVLIGGLGSCKAQPQPQAAAEAEPVFEGLRHIEVLSADSLEGRGSGTAGSKKAQTYITSVFEAHGLTPFDSAYAQLFSVKAQWNDARTEGTNLVGYVPGKDANAPCIVVSAHYDHLGIQSGKVYNGADDNASGTAGMLATMAHFRQTPPEHCMVFAAFDAEEKGLQGAAAFLADPPLPVERMALNVNLDMIGRNDAGELYVAGTTPYPFLKPYLKTVADSARLTLKFGHDGHPEVQGQDWTYASDHGVFHQADIPFVYFGVEDHADYHKSTDDFIHIQPVFFEAVVETVIHALTLLDQDLDTIIQQAAADPKP